jgi:hypothetical protein
VKLARRFWFITILTLGAFGFTGSTRAIVVGQVDDFENGTLHGWTNGGVPGVSIESGGPAGANDNFMQVTATGGGGPGSRLTVFNRDQWLGDYVATNVNAIEMDLQNQGDVDLTIRLGFKEFSGPGAPGYLSAPFFLLAGSGWQHAIFLINPASVTAVGTLSDFNTFFAGGFSEMRIINEVGVGDLSGDPVAGQLGIDIIRTVPEPSATLLASIGLLLFGAACSRKSQSDDPACRVRGLGKHR